MPGSVCIILIMFFFGCVEDNSNVQKSTNNNPTGQFGLEVADLDGNNSNASRTANKGDIVVVHYTGRLTDGTIFDSSLQREPLEFELGAGRVIKGFDDAILGMKLGEKKIVEIPSSDAYGERKDELIRVVDSNLFSNSSEIVVGSEVFDSSGRIGRVIKIDGNEIIIDFNHILSGKALVFEIELISIK